MISQPNQLNPIDSRRVPIDILALDDFGYNMFGFKSCPHDDGPKVPFCLKAILNVYKFGPGLVYFKGEFIKPHLLSIDTFLYLIVY
jgi:hypothetical protein